MTQGSDSYQAAADAATPTAPRAAASGAAGAMALGSILSVAGILLLFLFFAFLIVALQSCLNARDRGEESRRRQRGTTTSGAVRLTSRGVDPELLRSLPVTVYHKLAPDKGQRQDDAVECAVCLTELQDGEEARFLPRCGHGFHAECVDMWLASHTTCPLCRLTVSKPPSLAGLPPVPPEPANYANIDLPVSVLLGLPEPEDHGAVTAVTVTTDVATTTNPSALVIEIPAELASATPTLTPTMTTPCDAAKSPGSARLRSIRRLWSFGRQGAGPGVASSSCSCADLEQGIS